MKIKVTDENGKVFEVEDLEKIAIKPLKDAKGDYGIDKILDAEGKKIDISKLQDSNDDMPKEIFVTLEATHSGKNLNHAIYPEDSLVNDHKTYLKDFAKPLLKNHDTHSEPLGRVVATDFIDSEIVLDKKAVELKIKVTDSDAIAKFIDGRYKTVSIGASASTITCDLCKQTIVKDGKINFCGHWRGETYDVVVDGTDETEKKTAYWIFEDMYFNEISVVNSPADRNAQVKSIAKVGDSVEDELSKSISELIKNSKSDDDLLDSIDQLISDKSKVEDDEGLEEPEDDVSLEGEEEPEDNDNGTGEEPESVEDNNEELEKLKKENKELKDANEELSKKNKALNKLIDKKDEEFVDLSDMKEVLEQENKIILDKVKVLARKLKGQLENQLMDLKVVTFDSEITDEHKKKFKREIRDLSIKEMSVEINDLKKKIKPRKLTDNTIGENVGDNVETLDSSEEGKTMGDFLKNLNN